jgi:hypothetical protein
VLFAMGMAAAGVVSHQASAKLTHDTPVFGTPEIKKKPVRRLPSRPCELIEVYEWTKDDRRQPDQRRRWELICWPKL